MRFFCKSIQVLCLLGTLWSPGKLWSQSINHLILNEQGNKQHYQLLKEQEALSAKNARLWSWIEKGYVFANFDTLQKGTDTLELILVKGSRYPWAESQTEDLATRKKTLEEFSNKGYPFAYYQFERIDLETGEITGDLILNEGPRITFDSSRVIGESPLSKTYLHTALGVKPGELYSEKRYKEIPDRVARLNQISLDGSPDIGFSAGKATPILRLKKNNSDQFEGILGVLPDGEGSSQVTGYLNLDLGNLFRSGKELHLKWNRFAPESQQLDLNYKHPFFLQSNITAGVGFFLLRQDSAFVKRNFSLDFDIPLGAFWTFSLSIATNASDVLGTEPDPVLGLDYRLTEYRPGVSFGDQRISDSFINGIAGNLSFGFGDKRIRRNQLFDPAIYDSIQIRSSNYQFDGGLQLQRILTKSTAIYSQLSFGILEGRQILQNEFYRLGGLLSLRGFNENFFFAREFLKLQNEYRLFFDEKSYLLALFEIASITGSSDNFFTTSVGGGLSFDTSSGRFNFIFALGEIDGFTYSIQEAKVHFGYAISF